MNVERIINEVAEGLWRTDGAVVVRFPPDTPAPAVFAMLAEVAAYRGDTAVSDLVWSWIHEVEAVGATVVFEGPLPRCDHVMYMLTRPMTDREWVRLNVAVYGPFLVEVGALDPSTVEAIVLNQGDVPDGVDGLFMRFLPRPHLDVEVLTRDGT